MTLAALAPELVTLALVFEDRAMRVEALADQLEARVSAATWQGPAAERFRAVVGERRQHLRTAAYELRATAAHARTLASAALA